jgi:hypothetical protein
MNIRHHRHRNLGGETPHYFSRRQIRRREPQEAAPHSVKLFDPGKNSFPPRSGKVRKVKAVFPHGLDYHRKTASHCNSLDVIKTAYG